MTLQEQTEAAVADCRDQLNRVPEVSHTSRWTLEGGSQVRDDAVMVWVRGWSGADRETNAVVEAVKAAGLSVERVSFDDFGDEDCMKVTGMVTVTA